MSTQAPLSAAVQATETVTATAAATSLSLKLVDTKIVYDKTLINGHGIWIMNGNGSEKRLLSNTGSWPTIAPSRQWVVYLDYTPGFDKKLAVQNYFIRSIDGKNLHAITGYTQYYNLSRAAWSADSKRLLYTENNDVHVINSDGSGNHILPIHFTDNSIQSFPSTWAPDGQHVLLSVGSGFYSVGIDGQGGKLLIGKLYDKDVFDPVYSPDGQKLAFTIGANGVGQIAVANSDGTNVQLLTDLVKEGVANAPTWSPDGTQIAFRINGPLTGKSVAIGVMSPDGSNKKLLTPSGQGGLVTGTDPDWR